MDDIVASVYLREIRNQTEAAHIATLDYRRSLRQADIPRSFASAQAILGCAAQVSKLLWPNPASRKADGSPLSEREESVRKFTLERGRDLRRRLKIKSPSVLESRSVRNSLEHFDHRLDEYFVAGNRHVFDRNIGPKDMIVVGDGRPATHLRLIDPVRGTVSVLDNEASIPELVSALSEVASAATQALSLIEPVPPISRPWFSANQT